LLPITHMKRHGNYRQRPEDLEHLKALVDHRTQILRIRLKVENQLRAYKRRTDYLLPHTLEILEGMRLGGLITQSSRSHYCCVLPDVH